ncbi:MAG: NUDIX hydrolase [Hyphomicrobiaceae bacterium]
MTKSMRRMDGSSPEAIGVINGEQYAALPYVAIGGGLLVCLATSRETRRWIIPKGWPKKKLAPHVLAAEEAMEEAGLAGHISPAPLGSYVYEKRFVGQPSRMCRVVVFPLLVTSQALDWPERAERELVWVPATDAAALVDEAELAAMLRALPFMPVRRE